MLERRGYFAGGLAGAALPAGLKGAGPFGGGWGAAPTKTSSGGIRAFILHSGYNHLQEAYAFVAVFSRSLLHCSGALCWVIGRAPRCQRRAKGGTLVA